MKWIDVNDRLPKEEGTYIVYIHKLATEMFFDDMELSEVASAEYSMESTYESETEDIIIYKKCYEWDRTHVTHWMPFPNKPEGES